MTFLLGEIIFIFPSIHNISFNIMIYTFGGQIQKMSNKRFQSESLTRKNNTVKDLLILVGESKNAI